MSADYDLVIQDESGKAVAHATGPAMPSIWAALSQADIAPEEARLPVYVTTSPPDSPPHMPHILRGLERHFTLWANRRNTPGSNDWKDEVRESIGKAPVVVLVLSPRSLKDKHVRFELIEARRRFVPIVPVVVAKCRVPQSHKNAHDLTRRDADLLTVIASLTEAIQPVGHFLFDQSLTRKAQFAGRKDEITTLHRMVDNGGRVAVVGQTGVGKSMLVDEFVRRAGPRYPGGVLYERRGMDSQPVMSIGSTLRRWAQAILHPVPLTFSDELTPEIAAKLFEPAGHLLAIFDDVRSNDADTIAGLLPTLPQSTHILVTTTSEEVAAGLGLPVMPLEAVTGKDSERLLRSKMTVPAEWPPDHYLRRIWYLTEENSLGVELLAGFMRSPGNAGVLSWYLDELSANLEKGLISLEAETAMADDASLRLGVLLDFALDVLREEDPVAARCFAAAGALAPLAAFDAEALLGIWSLETPTEGRRVLDLLVSYQLLKAHANDKYSMHTTVHRFARAVLDSGPADMRQLATNRHALYHAAVVAGLEEYHFPEVGEHHTINVIHATRQSFARMMNEITPAEYESLYAALLPETINDESISRTLCEAMVSLASAVARYVFAYRMDDGREWFRAGLVAARLLGDEQGEDLMAHSLGLWHHDREQWAESLAYYERSLALRRVRGDAFLLGRTLAHTANVLRAMGHFEQALDRLKEASTVQQQAKDDDGLAHTLAATGEICRSTGHPQEAMRYFQQSLRLARKLGDQHMQSDALNNMGLAMRSTGNLKKALKFYQRAADLRSEFGDRSGLAITLNNIGEVFRGLEMPDEAFPYYEHALALQEDVGDDVGRAVTLNNLGLAYNSTGQTPQALASYEKALAINQALGNRAMEATTLANMAGVYRDMDRPEDALANLRQALGVFREIGEPAYTAASLVNMASLLREMPAFSRRGEPISLLDRAIKLMEEAGISQAASGVTLDELRSLLDLWRGGE